MITAIRRILGKRAPSLLRYAGITLIDVSLFWLTLRLASDGFVFIGLAFIIVAFFLTVVFFMKQLAAYRWMAAGLSLMMVFTVYPIVYTFYIASTNTGHGHVLTKEQAIASLERQYYLPDEGTVYRWTAFKSASGGFALWLQADDTPGLLARPNEPLVAASPGEDGVGPLDEDGIPLTLDGYERLDRKQTVVLINTLGTFDFGVPPNTVRVKSLNEAATLQSRYRYEPSQDAVIDQQTGISYSPKNGSFVSEDGEKLTPGFFVGVGTHNFKRFFSSSALRGPLVQIVIWNFAFAFFSVLLSFALGLFIALLFDDLPGKKIIRALLIIPYPIPALVSILIWRNLLNPDFGAITNFLESTFGTAPNWLLDPMWARVAVILINMWLSYPYFYIVSSGALQAIPRELFDAAAVDGANIWDKFRRITLPLLLSIVSPLLIASFSFNFNNFNLIYIFNQGRPPIAGTPIPAGHTDILLSFVYKLAFTSSQSDYGLASAISIMLFLFVGLITWLQFRYTRALEDRI
jgi:ABC-type sugar transport system permease subunit